MTCFCGLFFEYGLYMSLEKLKHALIIDYYTRLKYSVNEIAADLEMSSVRVRSVLSRYSIETNESEC